jgi:hypothetical protein
MWKWIKNNPATIAMWIAIAIVSSALLFVVGVLLWLIVVYFDVLWPLCAGVVVMVAVLLLPIITEKAGREWNKRHPTHNK